MDIQNFADRYPLKMLKTQEEKDSLFKAARIIAVIEQQKSIDFIEKILKTKGDINYKIPNQFVLNEDTDWLAGGTILHATRRYNGKELEVVKLFLKYEADFTIKSDLEKTALHEALHEYYHSNDIVPVYKWPLYSILSDPVINEILSMHVKKSIKENPGNRYGLTHFHVACMADHHAAVEFFLNNQVPVDLRVNENSQLCPYCTPLHIAVKSCAINVVKVLLKHGVNQHLKDNEGKTAMHWLIERNRRIVDFEELERTAETSISWLKELEVNQKIVQLLLNNNKITTGILIDEIGLSDLHIACTLGNAAVVQEFLNKVSQIDYQVNANSGIWPGYTALHFAAHFDLDTVELLVNAGGNLMIESTNGYTPFEICLERYPINDIYSIISTRPEWRSITLIDGKTKLLDLMLAMQNIDQFKHFLDERVDDVNNIYVAKDSVLLPGTTILHLAVLFSEQTKNRSNYTYDYNGYAMKAEFHPNVDLVEECLIRGADVTIQDLAGYTPLHLAFRYHKTDTIKRMLQFHHSSVNPIEKYNLSHLHIACAAADKAVVKKMLQSGVKMDLKVLSNFKFYTRIVNPHKHYVSFISIGSTPLHVAVATQSYEVTKLLVKYGADVNEVDLNGVTPIHRLLIDLNTYDTRKISKVVLSANLKEVVVAGVGLSHLFVASYFNNGDAVKRLINLGADVNVFLGNRMELNNFYDLYGMREFKESDYDITAKATALNYRLYSQSKKVLTLLINNGADILSENAYGNSALFDMFKDASSRRHLPAFMELFDRDEALTRRVEEYSGLTRLHIAAFLADIDVVRKLLDTGANVNAQINDNAPMFIGHTPLHFLIMGSCNELINEYLETMKLLLAAGADVTLTDDIGDTPLHLITNIKENWLKLLVELMWDNIRDFHVNPVGECGISLFHVACFHDNLPIMKKFLECGVDIDERIGFFVDPLSLDSDQGSSALHLIIDESSTRIETMDFLLTNGADVNAQNIGGSTPLHSAICSAPKRVDIFEKLIRAGADVNKLNEYCITPFEMLLCSDKSTPEAIKLFIDHGCGVNIFDNKSKIGYLTQPLTNLRCEEYNETAIWDTLFKSPDITKYDSKGRTSIHNIVSVSGHNLRNVAVEKYSILITRLCNIGCDIDSQDQAGETALHYAVHFKNNKAIAILLMNGSNINIIDRNGKTAFSLALEFYESRSSDEEDFHMAIIETFFIHSMKVQYFKLELNRGNRDVLSRVICIDFIFELIMDKLKGILEKIKSVKSFTFEEDSISFKLGDILTEIGLVAAYPILGCERRSSIDNFFENFEIYMEEYTEVVGLLRLQYRKAIKRITLMQPASKSLKITVGFPLPEICCSIVMRFLSNADLENLISSTGNAQIE